MSNELFKAVRYALYAGTTAAVGLSGATAFAQDAQDQGGQKLETITVTGSNIRRVDIETSNPVISIDRASIQQSGKVTVGDLVQQLPTIAGNANNPNVNNGGGTGGSFISLRGLGSNRTLILVDGKRVTNGDVNAIPAAAIERIEVLTDGASAIYGSDAIAGVVNFILRKDYQGAELQLNYGISDKDDGERKGFSLMFGQSSDKGSIMGGIDYNKTDQILASHRDFSKFTYNLSRDGSTVTPGGSAASPSGLYGGFPQFAGCSYYGYGTFDANAPGGNGIPAHFRCFNGLGPGAPNGGQGDTYNYAAINLITTPQERTNFFLNGDYKLTDSVDAYFQVFHNSTNSAAQLAPVPLGLASGGLTIGAGNPYNPFGVDIGAGSPDGEDINVRLTALGPRIINFSSRTDQARIGIKGNLFDTDWQYDLWGNYGHQAFQFHNVNYLNGNAARTALSGDCTPIVPGQPLTPNSCLDLFDQSNPNTATQLQQFFSLNADNGSLQTERQGGLDVNGTLFDLPGGAVSLATGVNYRKFYIRKYNDTVETINVSTGKCPAGVISLCNTPYTGQYDVKEAYAELFVPILKDLPFVHSLNVTLGDRYSKYSNFGNTNNWKVALEYRPIEDLLLRGTVSEVFRAPNTTESYTGLTASFDSYSRNAGIGEPRSTNGSQIQTIFSGANVGGYPIKPETGKTFDFGVVYDPQWLPGLSVSADLWRIYLLNNITRPTGQTIVDLCYRDPRGPGVNPYCSFINYNANGTISTISGVTYTNLGRLDTKGVDFAASYKLPETAFGNFAVSLNTTYLTQYDNTVPGLPSQFVAGTYNQQFGSFPRWRALGNISWQMGDFSAAWTQRFIGREKDTTFPGYPGGFLPIGAVTYHNVQFGYNIEPINTRIDVGVDNVGDKQPPLFYQSVTNANIDINTYDPIGRFYWGRLTVKF